MRNCPEDALVARNFIPCGFECGRVCGCTGGDESFELLQQGVAHTREMKAIVAMQRFPQFWSDALRKHRAYRERHEIEANVALLLRDRSEEDGFLLVKETLHREGVDLVRVELHGAVAGNSTQDFAETGEEVGGEMFRWHGSSGMAAVRLQVLSQD